MNRDRTTHHLSVRGHPAGPVRRPGSSHSTRPCAHIRFRRGPAAEMAGTFPLTLPLTAADRARVRKLAHSARQPEERLAWDQCSGSYLKESWSLVR